MNSIDSVHVLNIPLTLSNAHSKTNLQLLYHSFQNVAT